MYLEPWLNVSYAEDVRREKMQRPAHVLSIYGLTGCEKKAECARVSMHQSIKLKCTHNADGQNYRKGCKCCDA